MAWYDPINDILYEGDLQPGGRLATEEEVERWEGVRNQISSAAVDAEKERRLELGMDYYNPLDETTYTVQIRDRDMLYIISMATFALDRRANYYEGRSSEEQETSHARPGSYTWLDFTTDFTILDAVNTAFNIDAWEIQTLMINMAVARHSIIIAAQNIKSLGTIPSDYADDSRWPPLPTGGRS